MTCSNTFERVAMKNQFSITLNLCVPLERELAEALNARTNCRVTPGFSLSGVAFGKALMMDAFSAYKDNGCLVSGMYHKNQTGLPVNPTSTSKPDISHGEDVKDFLKKGIMKYGELAFKLDMDKELYKNYYSQLIKGSTFRIQKGNYLRGANATNHFFSIGYLLWVQNGRRSDGIAGTWVKENGIPKYIPHIFHGPNKNVFFNYDLLRQEPFDPIADNPPT